MRVSESDQRARTADPARSPRGLLWQVMVAGMAIGTLVAVLVVVVWSAAREQHQASRWADHSALVLDASQASEREVVDLETSVRGYAATGSRLFLAPWYAARAALPHELTRLRVLTADNPKQSRAALGLQTGISAYVGSYSAPLVGGLRPPRGAQLLTSMKLGKTLVDALRARFTSFDRTELGLQAARDRRLSASEGQFDLIALSAGAAVLLGVLWFIWFVVSRAVLPLRRAIEACARVAAGERQVALPGTGAREVRELGRTFDEMVAQLRARELQLHDAGARALDRERQLGEAQTLAGVGSWEWELAHPAFRFSDELCRLVGRPAGFSPSYQEFVELIHPDDREYAKPSLEPVAEGRVQALDYRLLRPDGEVRYVTARRYAHLSDPGEVTHICGSVQDITERREADRARQEAQAQFKRAFEDGPIGTTLMALDGSFVHVNAALCAMLGYTREELTRIKNQAVTHPEDAAAHVALTRRVLAGELRSYQLEKRFLHRDGHVVWVKVWVSLVRDESGEPRHFVGQIEDVSERRAIEAALRDSEQRYLRIAANIPGMVYRFAMSPEGEFSIPFASEGAREIYGVDAAELMANPRRALEAIHSDDAPEFLGPSPESAKRLSRWEWHGRVVMPDGAVRHLHGSSQPSCEPDGTIVWDGVLVDETEIHAAQELEAGTRLRLQLILENLPSSAVTLYDRDLRLAFCEGPLFADQNLGEMMGRRLPEFVSPDVLEQLEPGISAALEGRSSTAILDSDRTGRPLAVSFAPYRLADDTIEGALVHWQDISARRAAETAALAAEERFRRAFDDAPIGMALISLEGHIEQANDALGVISERTRSELEGLQLTALMHPADREPGQQTLRALAQGDSGALATEIRFVRTSGPSVDVFVHGTVLRGEDGSPTGVLCQFQDVTERKLYESQLQFMADHDPLTGLLNRRKFEVELDRHVAQVKRYGAEGALIALDIDNFKQINDTLGHNAGDELIVSISSVLRHRLRESDMLARLGGDEFAVLLPKADQGEAARVAEAILQSVRTKATLLDGEHKRVTASVGVAMFNPGAVELSGDSILVEADLAMYDAKEAGRDGYAFYSTSEHAVSATKARLTWVDRIEHALEHDRFTLAAQPILDLRTGQVRQHELLIRMLDDHGDLIPPATFLHVAERVGLMGRIDEWVTDRAIDLLEQRPELQLEVNISGRSLGDQRLLETIDRRLRASQVDPTRLIFEVTETAAVANVSQAQLFAQQLRDLGCRFALDDFGAGFGSFYYLKHLPFDFVKIDGEFVQHVATGRIDRLVIEAVVRIAQGLGKETIAEFVTDEKTQRMLARLGVDYAQGYHVGKPTPISELFALDQVTTVG